MQNKLYLDTHLIDWSIFVLQYLSDLACPLDQSDRNSVIDWLLGYAVRHEYKDNGKLAKREAYSVAVSDNWQFEYE